MFTWARITFRKTWLGSWFERRAFTCIANAFPITIRICELGGNILLLLRSPRALINPCAYKCMASARIFKMHTHESRSERALRSHVLESGFLGGSRSKTPLFSRFKSLIWNSFAFTCAKIRLSNQERAESRSVQNVFLNVILAHVNTAIIFIQGRIQDFQIEWARKIINNVRAAPIPSAKLETNLSLTTGVQGPLQDSGSFMVLHALSCYLSLVLNPGGGGGGGHVWLGPVHHPRQSLSEKHPKRGWSPSTI